jgi:hypothetical protein
MGLDTSLAFRRERMKGLGDAPAHIKDKHGEVHVYEPNRTPVALLSDRVPDPADTVAICIARFFVVGVEVDGSVMIDPLPRPVFSFHRAPAYAPILRARGEVRRPLLGAIVVASRHAVLISVEDV